MSCLRRCLELASRNVVLRRRLPRDFGSRSIYVSPDAALRFWIPGAEVMDPLLLKMVRALVRPGEKVWDLGANVGLFSFAAASLAGPSGVVLAIEPDPWLASLLNRSAARRRDDEAEVKILPAPFPIIVASVNCMSQPVAGLRTSSPLAEAKAEASAIAFRRQPTLLIRFSSFILLRRSSKSISRNRVSRPRRRETDSRA